MTSLNRRSTIFASAVVALAITATPVFAQDEESIESIVKAKPAPSHVFWKPLVDGSAQAWSRFADAAHLRQPDTCKHKRRADEPQCLRWSVSASYTTNQADGSSALSERVEDDVKVQMGQRPHFLLFLKHPF